MPGVPTDDAEAYLDQVLTKTLQNQREFLLVGAQDAEFYRLWLEGRCREIGFTSRSYGNYRGIEAVLFERNAAP